MEQKFWMCYVEGSWGCKYIHPNRLSAVVEAERLAKLDGNVGRKVYILEATQFCEVEPLPVKWGDC